MYIENKFSENALKSLKRFEVPIYMISSKLRPFIKAYGIKYPFNAAEIRLLQQTVPDDWGYVASKFKATSLHHVGSDYQYLAFYDMWALSDEILKICKTGYGYQIKKLSDLRRKMMNDYVKLRNRDPKAFITTIISVVEDTNTGESYCLKAPAVKHGDFFYFFNYQVSKNCKTDYFCCDEVTMLHKGDYFDGGTGLSYRTKYNGRYNWSNILRVKHIWEHYPEDTIGKLDGLVKKNNWSYCDISSTDLRPRLERKVS